MGGLLDTVSVDRQQPSPLLLLALRPLPLEEQWAHQQENKITQSAAVAVAHDAQHPAGVKKAPTKEAVACPHIPRWR